ncbi:hypothetical protein LSCM4_03469 [Leishmania orientalis]|uniref:Uncharacterized protein n=1 Tax=Leishmania orientalis TaxID=2249476 RepID=A0A836KGN2_9TRYP|nr:hypothetical protein LSCM4_03469 [Leishmania orientalis]
MPFWKNYIYTKPEVDDDDLPLPQHRLFDDDGHIREGDVAAMVTAAWRRSSTSSNASANAKKSPPLSQKRRVSLLKSVGVNPTTPLKTADLKDLSHSPSKAASRSPLTPKLPVRATSPEPQPVTSAGSTPRKATPKKASPKKQSSKQFSPKKSASRSPARARSPSPAKPKPVVKALAGRRRSRSRSNSRRKAAAVPSNTPSPKWNLAALKEFARDNAIQLKGAKTKAGILSAIHGNS